MNTDRASRIVTLTAGLQFVGVLTGVLCGALALVPEVVAHWLHPRPDYDFAILSGIAPLVAFTGAVLGAVCVPALAWSLLRRVSLWRVILWVPLGTTVGSFVGWALATNHVLPGSASLLGGPILGMLTAGVILRERAKRDLQAHLRALSKRDDG